MSGREKLRWYVRGDPDNIWILKQFRDNILDYYQDDKMAMVIETIKEEIQRLKND